MVVKCHSGQQFHDTWNGKTVALNPSVHHAPVKLQNIFAFKRNIPAFFISQPALSNYHMCNTQAVSHDKDVDISL